MTSGLTADAPAVSQPAVQPGGTDECVHATLTFVEAIERDWQVVVIGAGVGGGLAALQLARRGYRVLLVEKARLPRDKTCGGCLNPTALHALHQTDAADLLDTLEAPTVNALHLHHRRRSAILPLPTGRAVSRRALDAAMVERAIAQGAAYLDHTRAMVEPAGGVTLSHGADHAACTIRPGCTLVADGLAGQSLREVAAPPKVKPHARIGVGAVIEAPGSNDLPEGTIAMHCGALGYVGMTTVEADRFAIAAALDPTAIQKHQGPASVIGHILREAGDPHDEESTAALMHRAAAPDIRWHGVPALTRRRPQCAGHRWFALGDATGYVEPFTGEGMAWAMTAALRVQPFIDRAMTGWSDDLVGQWSRTIRDHRGRHQRTCRWVARTLRRPWAMTAAMALLTRHPERAGRVVGHLMRPRAGMAPRQAGRVEFT